MKTVQGGFWGYLETVTKPLKIKTYLFSEKECFRIALQFLTETSKYIALSICDMWVEFVKNMQD